MYVYIQSHHVGQLAFINFHKAIKFYAALHISERVASYSHVFYYDLI